MRSVGIDIGTNQVKIVEIVTTSKGFQAVAATQKTLSRATGTDLELEVIEFLREACANYDRTVTRFCVCLSQDKVAVRHKVFPFADRSRIQKTLPFELEEDVPFSTDNAIFDGKIIRTLGSTSEVLACATPKQNVERMLKLMKDSNIEPFLISMEGGAFSNLFERWNDPIPNVTPPAVVFDQEAPPEPVRPIRVVLNMGHTRTLVCAFDGNSLVGVRSILWGGRNLGDAIAKKYELAPAEAQKELERKGFILTTRQDASYEAKIFSDLIAKGVRELVRDLQLSLLEFKSEFGGIITQVQITGGVAGIQGLGPFLTQQLEVPVNRIPILDLVPSVQFERTEERQLRFGVALGLALEGLRRPRNPSVNFMKGEFAPQTSLARDLWKEWGLTIRAGAIALVILCVWSYGRGMIASDVEDASKEVLRAQGRTVAHLSSKGANEAGVKKFISENRKKIAEIKTLESMVGMNSAMDILSKISAAMPDSKTMKIDISNISIKDNDVSIAGYVTGDKSTVDIIRRSLTNVAADGNVITQGAVQAGPRNGFRIAFKVDRDVQPPAGKGASARVTK